MSYSGMEGTAHQNKVFSVFKHCRKKLALQPRCYCLDQHYTHGGGKKVGNCTKCKMLIAVKKPCKAQQTAHNHLSKLRL